MVLTIEDFKQSYNEKWGNVKYSDPIFVDRTESPHLFRKFIISGENHPEIDNLKEKLKNNELKIYSTKDKQGQELNILFSYVVLDSYDLKVFFEIDEPNREDYYIEIYLLDKEALETLFSTEENKEEVNKEKVYDKHLERFVTPVLDIEDHVASSIVKLETGEYVTILSDGTIIK